MESGLCKYSPYSLPGVNISTNKYSLLLILEVVCNHQKVRITQAISKSRKRKLVLARQLFCYFALIYTDEIYKEIGRAVKIDHSTVIHSSKIIQKEISLKYRERINQVIEIERIINKI